MKPDTILDLIDQNNVDKKILSNARFILTLKV
jgi:hypothetical protein